jgi:hypothetical protein
MIYIVGIVVYRSLAFVRLQICPYSERDPHLISAAQASSVGSI